MPPAHHNATSQHSCHVHRHVECRHQIEIEVWPATAEVYFSNERYADPAITQVRFDAVVYNSPSARVQWEVRSLDGSAGKGTIDTAGVYHAPPKVAGMTSGITEIICATAVDDPFRKAFAYVTVVGHGPAPAPVPTIEIRPKTASIYFPQNINGSVHNEFMDPSKKRQRFEAIITNTDNNEVTWKFNGSEQTGHTHPWIVYKASGSGSTSVVTISASLKKDPSISDTAKLVLENYAWPGKVD